MLYLLGSIILTSYLTISFKMLKLLHINSFQAIVFNYITCVITGSIVNGEFPINGKLPASSWFGWALIMGATFITLFNMVALTARQMGVAVATVAYKLSLVIPFVFSIYFYREPIGMFQVTGIILAMFAVVFTCYRRNHPNISESLDAVQPDTTYRQRSTNNKQRSTVNGQLSTTKQPRKNSTHLIYLLPLVLFLGSGLQDTMIKYVEQSFLHIANYNSFLITAFATAASLGVIILGYLVITGSHPVSYKAVLAGIAIGIPNYFSIWCLLKALKENTGRSAAIIPVNNMGIVLFSAVVAWLAFRERLTLINWIGIGLSIISIALIAFT